MKKEAGIMRLYNVLKLYTVYLSTKISKGLFVRVLSPSNPHPHEHNMQRIL